MRNLLTACLPALALFVLGGCASTSGLVSSEDDGVYYSAKDRTTAVVLTAPAPASADEAANPDYNGSAGSSAARKGSGSDQYYDESYTYIQGLRNTTPGVNYYTPYSPYTSLSYGVGAFGGYGGGYGGYSPYGYGGGFNDPFYSPYSSFYSPYGYGSGLSISFGFGRPFGYGGFGGYGYGSGFYDPYYHGGYYGGYYGRGGYYGNNYYGGNYNSGNYYGGNYNNGYGGNGRYDNNGGNRTYGHRTDRASDGRYSSGSGVSTPGTVTSAPNSGGRMRTDGRSIMDPTTTPQTMPSTGSDSRRVRSDAVSTTPNADPTRADGSYNKPRRMDIDGPVVGTMPGADQSTRDNGRGRLRSNDGAQPSMQPQEATAQPEGQRRGGFFQRAFPQPNTSGGQAAEQPVRQRSYDQPRQQRTYEQPQQRTYEQQQQQRSYEQPQRSYSQPSAPSYGGGGGGGNRGGGGGGGRRGRD
jgi:hypothetical protein